MLRIVRQIRRDHPKMSARVMYDMIRPVYFGRDKFEKICFENGFKVSQKPNFKRTTNSWGVTRFANLTEGVELNRINQVWVSDITYYEIEDRFVYITLIMDLFSREVIGHQLSSTLRTVDTTLPALKMGIEAMGSCGLQGTIFHSDGGGQYYDKAFRKLLCSQGMRSSMAENVYENPHAERLNRTIKTDYLKEYRPANYKELKSYLDKTVVMYNNSRPHKSLNGIPPAQFRIMSNSTKQQAPSKREKQQHSVSYNNIVKPSKVVNLI